MELKTQMSVNVERFMAHLQKDLADLPAELVKNAIEVEDSTTINIWLRDDVLVVENDGTPLQTTDDVQQYLLTAFETSKDKHNFGKGFTAVLMEEVTEVYTGCIQTTIHSWNDITIKDSDHFQPGMKVIVHLKEDSNVIKKGPAKLARYLSNCVTTKIIILNDVPIETYYVDQEDYTTIFDGKVKLSMDYFGHYFELCDGSLVPVELENITRLVSAIVCDVSIVDTERSKVTWGAEWRINDWARKAVKNKKPDSVPPELVPWIEEWIEWVKNLSFNTSKKMHNISPNLTRWLLGDIRKMQKWIEVLNKVAQQGNMKPFNKTRPRMEDSMEEIYKIVCTGYLSDYELRTFGSRILGDPVDIFSDIKIGVYVVDGEVDGNAFVSDLSHTTLVHSIDNSAMWDSLNEAFPPFIAYYISPDMFHSTEVLDISRVLKESGTEKVSVELPPPDKVIKSPDDDKMELVAASNKTVDVQKAIHNMARKRTSAADEDTRETFDDELGGIEVEGRPDFRFVEYKGVWCLVHRSVKSMDEIKFTPRIQREKWKAWTNTVSMILQYTGNFFCEYVTPAILVTKKNTMLANHVGYYVGLNRVKTTLPSTKYRKAMYLMLLAIHELTHFKIKSHGARFTQVAEDTFLALVKDGNFLSDLLEVI